MFFVLLPLSCWMLIAVIFFKRNRCLRRALLSAAVIWGVAVTAMTEGLSLFRMLNRVGLVACWSTAIAATFLIAFGVREKAAEPSAPSHPSGGLWSLFAGVAAIVALTGLIAVLAPPNNFDSMTYHMSRVMHWIQNRSVAHYPTHITRQLYSNPWAEFAVTHLQLLSGGDRLANLVQWFSMAGSIVGATLIAEKLGADRRGKLFAAVAVATIPMGILQASSTQNDYVTAFWLVCFVYFGLLLKEKPERYTVIMAGMSLGLAILTKATAYIYALPFAVWFSIALFRSSIRRSFVLASGMAALILALNAGHYLRNFSLFGTPLSSDWRTYTNGGFAVSTLFSNVLRNLALHLATPFDTGNWAVESGVTFLHGLAGSDVNDPRTTWTYSTFKLNRLGNLHEDFAGNMLHFLLLGASCAVVTTHAKLRMAGNFTRYLGAALCGFLLFCWYLRWQPFNSRLQLPVFVLGAPVLAVALSGISHRKAADAVMLILLVCSVPCVVYSVTRPLVTLPPSFVSRFAVGFTGNGSIVRTERVDQYFSSKPSLRGPFLEIASLINAHGSRNIGLKLNMDDWEYPLWALVRNNGADTPRIEHVEVANRSGKIGLGAFRPEVMVTAGADSKMAASLVGRDAHEQ